MFWNSDNLHLLSSTRLLTLISPCIGMSSGSLPNQRNRCKAARRPLDPVRPYFRIFSLSACVFCQPLRTWYFLRFEGQHVSVSLRLQLFFQPLKQATSVPCNYVLLMRAVPGSQQALRHTLLPMAPPFALMHRLKLPVSL
jgi:hypothetical protein